MCRPFPLTPRAHMRPRTTGKPGAMLVRGMARVLPGGAFAIRALARPAGARASQPRRVSAQAAATEASPTQSAPRDTACRACGGAA